MPYNKPTPSTKRREAALGQGAHAVHLLWSRSHQKPLWAISSDHTIPPSGRRPNHRRPPDHPGSTGYGVVRSSFWFVISPDGCERYGARLQRLGSFIFLLYRGYAQVVFVCHTELGPTWT